MAVYKVIQDIESEDKLLGPLTLKGFIYAAIAGLCIFIEFRLLFIGTPLKFVFMFIFALPAILFGTLASPLGREQPTEVWLLSRIKFFFKARKRTWDQSGLEELVTITAPKRIERMLTKDLTPGEVDSRLKALAMTLDTRGWAIKNINVNLNTNNLPTSGVQDDSDRLVASPGMDSGGPSADVHPADDILDERNNPTAQKFVTMMLQAEDERRHGIMDTLRGIVSHDEATAAKDTGPAPLGALSGMSQKAKEQREWRKAKEEAELKAKLAEARSKFSLGPKLPRHQLVGRRVTARKAAPLPPVPKTPPPQVTAARQADNMELAQSGNDLSVASLSELANRPSMVQQTGPNEVTINLH